jgi:polysaccharide pyruvyl transferase WcaK-like protein
MPTSSRPAPSHDLLGSDAGGSRAYEIALFGIFGVGNFGNDATLETCLALVRDVEPATRVLCVTTNPDGVAQTFDVDTTELGAPPVATYSRRSLRRIVSLSWSQWRGLREARRALRHVETFVVAGTGVLDDQHTTSQLALDVFRWSLAGRLAGAKVVVLSVGAGPIDRRLGRVLTRAALWLAHDVSYRDARSRDYMRSIGRNVSRDRVLPDLVLSWQPRVEPDHHEARQGNCVAVGVLWEGNWRGRPADCERYLDRMVALIELLATDGFGTALMIGDESDVGTLSAIRARAAAAGCHVAAADARAFGEVVSMIEGCVAVVASRYHNLIAGVLADRPVISLGYGPKNVALMEQLGTPERSHDIDTFDVDRVADQVRSAARTEDASYEVQIQRYRAELRPEFEAICNA